MNAINWYYLSPGAASNVLGPISTRDVDVMLRIGELSENTLMCREGMQEWKMLRDVEELANALVQSLREEGREVGGRWGMLVGQDAGVRNNTSHTEEQRSGRLQEIAKEIQGNNRKNDVPASIHEENIEGPQAEITKAEILEATPLTPEEHRRLERKRKKKERQRQKKLATWYNPKINSNIYINGLPPDISMQEITEFFAKAGIIRVSGESGQPKIKIYTNPDGTPKGDGLVSYVKEESVVLALEILNEREIRPGFKISIEQAQFQQKGQYKERDKKELDKIAKIKLETREKQLLGWDEDDEGDGLKIVIIKNMFTPDQVIVTYMVKPRTNQISQT